MWLYNVHGVDLASCENYGKNNDHTHANIDLSSYLRLAGESCKAVSLYAADRSQYLTAIGHPV